VDVEIKVNFEGAQIEQAMQFFRLDPGEAKKRKIWFGEVLTGEGGRGALPLLGRGVILRVRGKKKDSGDVTLKLRGPDGCVDAARWTAHTAGVADETKVEGDWADRRLVSASLVADFTDRELEPPGPSILALMPDGQQELARELLFIPLDEVELLGPIAARKWEHKHEGDVDAEEWTVGTQRFLEISVLAHDEPEKAQEELLRRVKDAGLTAEEGQEPKTTRVLKFLAGATE